MSKQNKPQNALAVLKKNLNVWELKELVELLEAEIERQTAKSLGIDHTLNKENQ